MIRVEAAGDRFGVLVDYIYLGLSDTAFSDQIPTFPQGVNFRADLDLNVLELAGTYRFGSDDSGADLGTGWKDPGFDDGAWDVVGPSSPSILLTEIGTAQPADFVEIQNVSGGPVSTAGWPRPTHARRRRTSRRSPPCRRAMRRRVRRRDVR